MSSSPQQVLPPDIIHGVPQKLSPLQSSKFNFNSSSSTTFGPKTLNSSGFKINPSVITNSTNNAGDNRVRNNFVNNAAKPSNTSKRKTDFDDSFSYGINERLSEPQRKVHLNEEVMAQTLSELYISHPRPKVARRNIGTDVAEAMNLSSLEELESKFSHQAAISNTEEHFGPPLRQRKLPNRSKIPQLRVSLHQDIKNLRSPASVLPESILAKYRQSPRSGSTAVVLWKPPGGIFYPDIVSSTLRSGPGSNSGYTSPPVATRPRIRCYSEVTTTPSTPYSSNENLASAVLVSAPGTSHDMGSSPTSTLSPCAEAPELSTSFVGEFDEEIPIGVNIHRRNSAPEINESFPFNDDTSMEL